MARIAGLLFGGRLNRRSWLMASLTLELISSFIGQGFHLNSISVLSLGFYGLVFLVGASIDARRFHDTGKTGFLALFTVTPLAIFRVFILYGLPLRLLFVLVVVLYELGWDLYLLLKPGDKKDNKYGKVPEPRMAFWKTAG